ncbi:gamma-interferon-inducible lysosomal thiol reductase [Nephila pilipes]|uniref:Gamma-interferon-inducible lysosomal thiol reductase n=1 Tax=Nephila pilipes TaxID=299642 RepID=A0A8X6ULI9_NEPPI|nr:gamma-interferon-inducible lysosomal thiol reductase [Nephila pilipes]
MYTAKLVKVIVNYQFYKKDKHFHLSRRSPFHYYFQELLLTIKLYYWGKVKREVLYRDWTKLLRSRKEPDAAQIRCNNDSSRFTVQTIFLFISDNMWLVFGCLTITAVCFQNVNAQYGYAYDPRYSFNSNRRSYAVYPSYTAAAAPYPSNSGSRTSYASNVAGGGASFIGPIGSGAVYSSNNAPGAVYPSVSRGGVVYPSYTNNGAVYPSNSRGGVAYPSYSGNGAAYPGNIAGVAYPSSVPIGVVSNPDSSGRKVNLDVYYETNCPDSMRFITTQLYPVYRDFKDIVSVHLIPFGKARASYDANSNKYEFQCHHGPRECYGNTVQGCAISLYPDTETHLEFINCMESYPRPSESGSKCARRLSMDWKSISKCADGEAGKQILYKNGELTNGLQPSVTFVPWININKVHSDSTQRQSLRDLKSAICDAYKGRHPKC